MHFEDLGLEPVLLSAIRSIGFKSPTPVQVAAIPPALSKQDLMVSAETGSGKTAAFILPALQHILKYNSRSAIQVLILTPTRELAQQITEAAVSYGRNIPKLKVATIVGGMSYTGQFKVLSRRIDLLIATPGRLIDHIKSNRIQLNNIHTLILDEADRMLDMGFIDDINMIVESISKNRQTLLFSATLDGDILNLVKNNVIKNPRRIDLSNKKEHSNIKQSLLYVDSSNHKKQLLNSLLRDNLEDQTIVFTSTKRGADTLAEYLVIQGFAAAALHGDMNQRQRTRTLLKLQNRQLHILIATDIASRGIDIKTLNRVINFDLPMQTEDYVHRIGRTGRAGRNGFAFTLVSHSEQHKIRRIENYIGKKLT